LGSVVGNTFAAEGLIGCAGAEGERMPLKTSRPIVVVEDNEDDFFVFTRLLATSGVTDPVLPFHDSDEAIRYLGRVASGGLDRPLVCFLDIKMPGYTGFDVLEALRSSEVFDGVPAIILSTSDDRRDVVASSAKGAQGYLVKYPSAETLRCVVEEARVYAHRPGAQNPTFKIKANLLRSASGTSDSSL
jgi:CheY-like chemotaxis protein